MQHRQLAQQHPFLDQSHVRDRAGLAVHTGVDLRTPVAAGVVQPDQVIGVREHEIGFCVADEVLDDALDSGSAG